MGPQARAFQHADRCELIRAVPPTEGLCAERLHKVAFEVNRLAGRDPALHTTASQGFRADAL